MKAVEYAPGVVVRWTDREYQRLQMVKKAGEGLTRTERFGKAAMNDTITVAELTSVMSVSHLPIGEAEQRCGNVDRRMVRWIANRVREGGQRLQTVGKAPDEPPWTEAIGCQTI